MEKQTRFQITFVGTFMLVRFLILPEGTGLLAIIIAAVTGVITMFIPTSLDRPKKSKPRRYLVSSNNLSDLLTSGHMTEIIVGKDIIAIDHEVRE